MATIRASIRFRADDIDAVVAQMDADAAIADGARWANIGPDVDESTIARGSWLGRAFSSRGPVVPMATWFPGHVDRKGRHQPTQLGFAHAAGADAVARLASRGVAAPGDWVLVQDHQRRGIVFAIPPGTSPESIVRYSVRALMTLSPFDTTGGFVATFSAV